MTFDGALEEIAGRAHRWDASTDWPFIDLSQLAACGAFRWAVPREFGGDELPTLELHLLYERLATASVATALILNQRDAAVSLIDANVNAPKRANMLRRLGKGELWMTVGIAQLTTSRQGGKPALRAKRVDGGYRLDGLIPWCTGVHQAQFVVAGATLDDGQQVLFLMPRDLMGVEMGRPMIMVALTQTLTSSLRLKNVLLEDRWVLRPPSASALAGRRGLTLGQTFIATGLCQAALDLIAKHTSDAARSAHGRFAEQLAAVRTEVHALCQPGRQRPPARHLQRPGPARHARRRRHLQGHRPAGRPPRPTAGSRGDVPARVVVPEPGDRLHGRFAGEPVTDATPNHEPVPPELWLTSAAVTLRTAACRSARSLAWRRTPLCRSPTALWSFLRS
jgi:alkylation response protein AidB-like acyl-CoA dehydrogenase